VELVFPSRAMAERFGPDLTVLPPPIAFDVDAAPDGEAAKLRRPFTAGLIGRHFQSSSPNEDAHFLRALATASGALEIYDPGALRYTVGADAAIRCRTRGATSLREFLRSIDCLVHPPGKWWLEGDGRELFMAMAAGVPIVCPQTSIFAEYIDHGIDGLICEGRDAALEQVGLLRRSPELRADLARSSRSKVASLAAPERAASSLRRLFFGQPDAMPSGGADAVREAVTAK
jgi:glycosyltransferase involved in cell wall biosynthesis